jgi:hypothetical protein
LLHPVEGLELLEDCRIALRKHGGTEAISLETDIVDFARSWYVSLGGILDLPHHGGIL